MEIEMNTNMQRATEERQKRARLVDKAGQILQKAHDEERELTQAQQKVSRMKGDAIEMETQMSEIDSRLSEVSTKISGIEAAAGDIKDMGNSTIRGLANDIIDDADTIRGYMTAIEGYLNKLYELTASMKGS